MNTTQKTLTCECGAPAGVHEEGYALAIYNGMYNLAVCPTCWADPENVAVSVTVEVACRAYKDGLRTDLPWADLDPSLRRYADVAMALELAERGVKDAAPYWAIVPARWDDWYAPAPRWT